MSAYKILYAEDDETLAFLTKDSLQMHGYSVDHFADGDTCLKAFRDKRYDLCILDIMLPGKDGFALAESIRKLNKDIPILFLSAKTLKEDRLRGLRTGADDYLVKPFSMEELILKIDIFLSRSRKFKMPVKKSYKIGAWVFDSDNYMLTRGKESILLTQKQAALLQYLLDNKNTVLRREQILNAVWGQDDYYYGRSLDVFISRLRKIFAEEDSFRIQTLHGIGFKLVDPNHNEGK